MTADEELLRRFANERDEPAFTELVRRRIDFVYAVALRQVGGDAHLAQDAAQEVFLDLARKARSVAAGPALVSWLYTATRFAAAKVRRRQTRWLNREQEALTMNTILSDGTDPAWETLRPVLDEAMHELGDQDRTALLLRYFENRPLSEVGTKLGLAENSARMRVDRALDKLRGRLATRGIASTAAALASDLAAQPQVAAPVGLAAAAAAAALSGTALSPTAGIGTFFFAMNKTAIAALGALLVIGTAMTLWVGSKPSTTTKIERPSSPPSSEAQSVSLPPALTEPPVMVATIPTASAPEPAGSTAPEVTLEGYRSYLKGLTKSDFRSEFTRLLEARREKGDFGFEEPYSMNLRAGAPQYGDPYVKLLLMAWGEQDPSEALTFLADFTGKPANVVYRYTDVVLAGWSHTDAPAAWKWAVDSIRTSKEAAGAPYWGKIGSARVAAVGDELIARDQFRPAADLIGRDDEYSGIMAGVLTAAWANADVVGPAAWISSLQNRVANDDRPFLPDTKGNALRGLAEAVATESPTAFRSLILATEDRINKSTLAAGAINSFKNTSTPLAAIQWFTTVLNENPGVPFSGPMRAYAAMRGDYYKDGSPEAAAEEAAISSIANETTRTELRHAISLTARK